ncbi:MAG TPA: small ribosomal subunit Rsm22 family protein [Terriglobales bacterium]|nr:small ribosomal subunit Rsm22 family protein [Terriglobales bacterium]
MLPSQLRAAIAAELAPFPEKTLARAAAELTSRYKSGRSSGALGAAADRAAYIALRLPATYAAVRRVLDEVHARAPRADVRTLLDLGAGPGAALWAAADAFPSVGFTTLIERDTELIAAGKRLAAHSPLAPLRNANWIARDLTLPEPLPSADLVIVSYALNELSPRQQAALIARAWAAARELLVIVEPGTPPGFANIIAARKALLASGAAMVAPCPHGGRCPMETAGDWCHFAARLERTAAHRRLKQAELGYEDEKFSYVALSRRPPDPAAARIVRHPRHHKGHTELLLCAPAGLQREVVTRSDKQRYRAARKAEWGDEWSDV